MAAMVLESDAILTEDLKKAGAYFGELTVMLGKIIGTNMREPASV